jgi:hypothetical protein
MREWLKANGGPPAVVVLGVVLLFTFWPLGVVILCVGFALWLYRWERFPINVSRRRPSPVETTERRELLGLAQAMTTELETCRYRLSEAKQRRRGWLSGRNLPAETYNTRWTTSLATADQVAVNNALRGFYIWADHMNSQMLRRAQNEASAVGEVLFGKSLALGDEDVTELDEGISRIKNAQEKLAALTSELRR